MRRHALLAPFGICGATALLAYMAVARGDYPSFLMSAGELVDLGAAVYGMVAAAIEIGVETMFWALERRRQRREAFRAAVAAEVAAAKEKEFSERLQPLANERGVTVEELLRELDDARAKRNGA